MNVDVTESVSLRKLLITRVSLLVAATMVLLSAGFVLLGLLPMARQVAESQFDTARTRVQAGLDAVFLPPARLLQMSKTWLNGVAPDLRSPTAFNQWFQPVLAQHESITSVVAGTSTGQGWLLLLQSDGSWRNRMTDLPNRGNQHHVMDHLSSGEVRTEWIVRDYDPRQRPWYLAAMGPDTPAQVAWTDPYVFFTTGDAGISASMRMPLAVGGDLVLGFDLKLKDLSKSTLQAKVGQHGLALVVSDDGRVLALPAKPASIDEAQWLKQVLKPVEALALEPVSAALQTWREAGRPTQGVLSYQAQGQSWLASVRPYSLGTQRLWVVTLAPAADFAPAWTSILSALAGLGVLLMGLVMLVARAQTERLTRPLERLARSSERIGQLNFESEAPVRSNVTEIQQLAQAQAAMQGMLRSHQTTLAAQADQLRHQLTQQQQAKEQVRRQNDILSILISHFPGGISMVDADMKVSVYNPEFKHLQNLPDTLFQGSTVYFEDIIRYNIARGDYGPGDPQQQFDQRMALARSQQPYRIERKLANGRVLEIRGTPLPGGGFVSGYSDITEHKKTEEKLKLAASVFTSTSEAITITDARGDIIDVNEAFTRITGYPRDEVLGRNPRLLSSGLQTPEFYARMWQELLGKGHWHGEIWNRRKNGEVFAEMLTINAVLGAEGGVLRYVALFSDITALKQHQAQLEYIAHFDALTSLPNRVLLADRLQQGLAQSQRRNHLLAVAYLDLDGFKAVNDRYGHEVGDQLLVALANLMRQTLREGDTLARLGGDEFVAVLLDLSDANASEPLITRLLAAAAQTVEVQGHALQLSASLGVTFYPQATEVDADQLLRQADQAMYQAKLAGRNRYCVFDADQDSSVRGHHESLERLRHALAAHEFVLYYQPKVNMRTGQIVGLEALIRWQHPERGLLAPAAFLPVLEGHALSIEVGEWVIAQALAQIAQWLAQGVTLPVSVNMGARQLQEAGFVARLGQLLAAQPAVSPALLALEVLETSALDDVAGVSQVMEACARLGVSFALDDFGTGYSSLTYLKRLPVNLLKIDQSFVRDMLDDPDDLAILHGVIGLATAFHRDVMAEGVETVEHGTLLLQLGCELAQGYGIARPMPGPDVLGWCQHWQPHASWLGQAPVRRAALPLLFAQADLRAWVLSLKGFLAGEHASPPPLDCHECQLGRWIDQDGERQFGALAPFVAMQATHLQIHALGHALLAWHTEGDHARVTAHLPEFLSVRDTLLGQLNQLMESVTA